MNEKTLKTDSQIIRHEVLESLKSTTAKNEKAIQSLCSLKVENKKFSSAWKIALMGLFTSRS